MTRIVVVTGGRDPKEFTASDVSAMMDFYCEVHGRMDELWHGAATGVDSWCDAWAESKGVERKPFPVSREEWRRIGPSAGPIRNGMMLAAAAREFDAGADVTVLAFPGGDGTASCVRIAERYMLRVDRFRAKNGAFTYAVLVPEKRQRPVSKGEASC